MKLVIVADLGLLRAYRQIQAPGDSRPHLEIISDETQVASRKRLGERETDRPGRFPRGNPMPAIGGNLSSGERLDLKEEERRRGVAYLAERIDALLLSDRVTDCSLAASAPIHRQLLESLGSSARSKIRQVLPRDLTRVQPFELLAHFDNPSA